MEWQIEDYEDELIEIRRHLHMHPELSFKEDNTKKYIADYLEALGIKVRRDVGGNGILGYIEGAHPGPTVAFRADFDALPIQDAKDVPYKSTVQNVMHACGHDGHTAMLLITAKILMNNRNKINGKIVLIHQHAEEIIPGGAKSMIEDGALDGVDYVFGTHTASYLPAGTIGFCPGPAYAYADKFIIQIKGKGGHGAAPHETYDAIIAASSLISQFQTIISRSVNPIETAVVTVGEFNAGDAFNVIADSAYLSGTVRTYKKEIKEEVIRRMRQLTQAAEVGFNMQITFVYQDGYPSLVNPVKETEWLSRRVNEEHYASEVINQPPSLGGEDFSYFLQEKPGTYFYTGVMNEKKGSVYPHHHPKFDLDEEGLKYGIHTFLTIVKYMNELA